MNSRHLQHSILTGLIGLALLFLPFVPAAADKSPTLSQGTYRELQSAEELLEKGKTTEALSRLKKLVRETTKKPYAQAVALQSLAHAYIDQGDYVAAIPYLKRCLDLQALPTEAQQQSRYNLAQLYLATERFTKAIELLDLWFTRETEPKADAYLLLGSAHLQLEHYKQAIKPLRKAIELSPEPKESWYQTLLGTYYETKDYKHCVQLLQRMLRLFPEKADYWRQLSGIEMLRKRPKQALAALELAYLRGLLSSERDLKNLAQLYMQRNAPYKAAHLLADEIGKGAITPSAKTWELIGNAWLQAKETERSIRAYEKAVAKGGRMELRQRLAQLYLEARRWSDARNSLRAILEGKESKWHARSWLLLGIASYEADALEEARNSFNQAMKFNKTRREAEQWLAYLDERS